MNIFRDPILFFAFGFGSGLAKKAPGTCGTLVAVPLFALLAGLDLMTYIALILALYIFGVWICDKASEKLGVHDHQGIVWDEIVGYLITMVGMPLSWPTIIMGFILFRFFDIVKPWPIHVIDRQVSGGQGIMLDDVLAGVCAAVCLFAVKAMDLIP